MPLYDYECEVCGEYREVYQHTDDLPPNCPECGLIMLRQVSAPSVVRGPSYREPLSSPVNYYNPRDGKMYRFGTRKKYD